MRSFSVLGTRMDACNMGEAVEQAVRLIEGGKFAAVVTPNAEMLWRAHRDPHQRALLNAASLSLPDGTGATGYARAIGVKTARVSGVDFGAHLAYEASRRGFSLYLLGGKEGVADAAAHSLRGACAGLHICGTRNGYFNITGEESDRVIEGIRESGAKIVYVCLGSPRQEEWVFANAEKLPPALYVCLGGSLDVYAGKVRRAPASVRRAGLEWAWRIAAEPSRIRRAGALPCYAVAAAKEIAKQKRTGAPVHVH